MDEQRAREILGDTVQADGGLYCLGHYTAWSTDRPTITLDCEFEVEELEAIVWWMRNKATEPKPRQVEAPRYVPPVLEMQPTLPPLVDGPWGSWELSGAWHHNPSLSMSAAEQRARNEASGYECYGTDGMS